MRCLSASTFVLHTHNKTLLKSHTSVVTTKMNEGWCNLLSAGQSLQDDEVHRHNLPEAINQVGLTTEQFINEMKII